MTLALNNPNVAELSQFNRENCSNCGHSAKNAVVITTKYGVRHQGLAKISVFPDPFGSGRHVAEVVLFDDKHLPGLDGSFLFRHDQIANICMTKFADVQIAEAVAPHMPTDINAIVAGCLNRDLS